MKTVGIVYLIAVVVLVLAELLGFADGRPLPLLELLLSPETLAAMMVGLGGQHFQAEFKQYLAKAT
jgi:hypothetical protein